MKPDTWLEKLKEKEGRTPQQCAICRLESPAMDMTPMSGWAISGVSWLHKTCLEDWRAKK